MTMMDIVFGASGKHYVQLIDELELATLKTEYPFEDNDNFENILSEDPKQGMQIYWNEILSRSHLCSIIGILRMRHWVSSLISATRDKNLLSFSAALRGLIESAADSSSSLNIVPLTLAHKYSDIVRNLSGESDKILVSSELEDALIHFAYARHLSASEARTAPSQHKARHVRDYIKILEAGNVENVVQCYREMCDLTHPGQSSVWMWLRQTQNTIHLSTDQDESIILHYLRQSNKTLVDLLMFGFNPSIITLKIINFFPIPRLHTPQLNAWNLSSIPAWKKCQSALKNSSSFPSKGLLGIQ